jgi:cell division protein ZapA
MRDDQNVAINLLGKEFLIACPQEKRDDLQAAARLLEKTMQEIKRSGKVFGLERIAVMAALNLSHDYLESSQQLRTVEQRCHRLSERMDQALAPPHEPD